MLAFGMIMGGSAMIEHQEAMGQRSLVQSETLPTKMDPASKAQLEKAGVKFGEKVEGDDMFQYVKLPTGWKKVRTDHSMWSNLVDEKGRTRASIFYKAAFYDRSAHLSTNRRYSYSFDYDRFEKEGVGVTTVTDGTEIIHGTEPINGRNRKSFDVSDEANKLANDWLTANYPDWQDAAAYWD